MSGMDFQQSIPICSALAACGGILEVFATAVLAYPASRSVEGFEWTDRQLKGCLAANIILQILASLAGNLFATWFGPVAIVGPIFFAAQLLANLVVFWIVLGLEAFSREMQIGTYVIVVAVVLLIVNGPGSQDYGDTTFAELITQSYALVWACLLTGAMLATGVIMTMMDLHNNPRRWFQYGVLLTARATGFSLNLSTGKALILPSNSFWLTMNIVIKVISGMIYTRAIVIQSTAVEQKVFVPLNAAIIVLVNALTGIIIWEDWRVVSSWVGYVCVFLLLALGCGLLLGDLGLLQESSPETFLGARMSMVYKDKRRQMLDRLKYFGKLDLEQLSVPPPPEGSWTRRRLNTDSQMQLDIDNQSLSESDRERSRRTTIPAGLYHPSGRPRAMSENVCTPSNVKTATTQQPVHAPGHRRSMSDTYAIHRRSVRPTLERRRSSVMFRPRKHQQAWMAVYQAAGATSRRSSAHLHDAFPVLSLSDIEIAALSMEEEEEDRSATPTASNTAATKGTEHDTPPKNPATASAAEPTTTTSHNTNNGTTITPLWTNQSSDPSSLLESMGTVPSNNSNSNSNNTAGSASLPVNGVELDPRGNVYYDDDDDDDDDDDALKKTFDG